MAFSHGVYTFFSFSIMGWGRWSFRLIDRGLINRQQDGGSRREIFENTKSFEPY